MDKNKYKAPKVKSDGTENIRRKLTNLIYGTFYWFERTSKSSS